MSEAAKPLASVTNLWLDTDMANTATARFTTGDKIAIQTYINTIVVDCDDDLEIVQVAIPGAPGVHCFGYACVLGKTHTLVDDGPIWPIGVTVTEVQP